MSVKQAWWWFGFKERDDGGLKVKDTTGKFGRVFGGHSDAVGSSQSERGSEVFLTVQVAPCYA